MATVSEVNSKYGNWYSERVILQFMCVGCWAGVSSLHSADESQEGRKSCPLLLSCFIGSCYIGVPKRFSRIVSPVVYCLSSYTLLADQISCRSYWLAVFIVCGPLQFLISQNTASSLYLLVDRRWFCN